jgi:hypothetical protein
MLRLTEVKLPLDHGEGAIEAAVRDRLGLREGDLLGVSIARRGWDARRKSAIELVYTLDLRLRDENAVLKRAGRDRTLSRTLAPSPDMRWHAPVQAPSDFAERPVVIGAGPCGLMATLVLAEMGFRPILLERGKPVRERTKDTWALWRRGILTEESNVQYGEGGAGLFSDGKLYSGIKDPQNLGRKLMEEFVAAGAPEEILYVSKPHIGTFRLVTVAEGLREKIERLGGEYRFGTRVVDLEVEERGGMRQLRGVVLENGEVLPARHVILALGHSARDGFAMLHGRGVAMEQKPFSIGVRIEHPQGLIDRARYGDCARHPILGPADYKLVHHGANGRSTYSFCMCPGGTVVAATSEDGGVVTNGMSQYLRAERNANAGIVVGITPADYPGGPLAGIDFQRHWEKRAYEVGGGGFRAPAQRVGDFLEGRASTTLGEVQPSYKPGVTPTDLSLCLPDYVVAAIREALPAFGRQIRGFDMADAVMTGVETRTSSPLRVPRGSDFQSLNTHGLYPAGEGAGYAGGIYSAGVDGIRIAEALARDMVAPAEARAA